MVATFFIITLRTEKLIQPFFQEARKSAYASQKKSPKHLILSIRRSFIRLFLLRKTQLSYVRTDIMADVYLIFGKSGCLQVGESSAAHLVRHIFDGRS